MTDQQWDIVTGVGVTALAVAAGRAIESGRPDALIDDPYAARFVKEAQAEAPFPALPGDLDGSGTVADDADPTGIWSMTSEYMGVRSRVFDDFLSGAADGGVTQVVILASGLDTRGFRLAWPAGTRCFELDQPAVLDFKLRVLREEGAEPSCDHHPVPVDLRDDWAAALEAAGFDRTRPTAWLAEGLLPYLPPEAEARLFSEITRLSAPGSRFAVEQINDMTASLDDPMIQESQEALGVDLPSLFPDGEREPVDTQLTALGWALRHVQAEESAAAYDRSPESAPLFARHIVHTFGALA